MKIEPGKEYRRVLGCVDEPSKAEPAIVQCPLCEGDDDHCEYCKGKGEIEIPHCPKLLMTRDVGDFVQFAMFADDGCMPVAGGVGDQCENFLRAYRFFKNEQAECEEEMRERRRRR